MTSSLIHHSFAVGFDPLAWLVMFMSVVCFWGPCPLTARDMVVCVLFRLATTHHQPIFNSSGDSQECKTARVGAVHRAPLFLPDN